MSGLLRRIKRSRTEDAGDPPAEEQAAGPERASTTAETAPTGDEANTTELPAATVPAIAADPDHPAGLDERAAAAQAPSGRRGRLRRRLRYLRRARELMLRDLGGLVYEVHRTGGADFGAHSAVIAGKVERLAILDAESGAIEHALGAPRSETLVFEPGVGGSCDVCGELYDSAARFCSRCGTPTDPAARHTEAPAPEPGPVPPMPKAPGTAETAVIAPAGDEERADEVEPAAGTAEPAAEAEPAEEAKPARRPRRLEPPEEEVTPADEPSQEQPADAPAAGEPKESGRNPFGNIANGRPDDKATPPELSSGDPLSARESRK